MPSDQRPFCLMTRQKISVPAEIALLLVFWFCVQNFPEEWSAPAWTVFVVFLLVWVQFWRILPVLKASKQDK
jgi:hypothetical protein